MQGTKNSENSRTHMTEMVLPQHTNPFGTAFGGVIMSWMDICAAIASRRHAETPVVTASVDELHFLKPISLGDTVMLDAHLTSVGHSSMEVYVHVRVEPLDPNRPIETTTQAYFTFVSLDSDGKPTRVPRLSELGAESDTEDNHAKARRTQRLVTKDLHRRGFLKPSEE